MCTLRCSVEHKDLTHILDLTLIFLIVRFVLGFVDIAEYKIYSNKDQIKRR